MNTTSSLGLRVAGEALRILENTRQTNYQHDICIDEATGTYDVDCSGFVSYILSRVAPAHLNLIPLPDTETRLLAHDYYHFVSKLSTNTIDGWQQILRLSDALPGDLVAWPLTSSQSDTGDTGHVFVVAEQPVALDADTMAVVAYDASDILHYDDSRDRDPVHRQTGVGSGTFHLKIDGVGKPDAFQFGPGDPIVRTSIAVGRIETFDAS